MHEISTVRRPARRLGELRYHEKNMVIDYEDGVAVLKHREAWMATRAVAEEVASRPCSRARRTRTTSSPARRSQSLDAYVADSKPVLDAVQNGAFDTAKVADRRLDKAKAHVAAVEKSIEAIDKIVQREVQQRAGRVRRRDAADAVRLRGGARAGAGRGRAADAAELALDRAAAWSMREQIARAIAAGDLTRGITVEGRDEASTLLESLRQMQEFLRTLVGQVRVSGESIGTASAEIASGNQDLSARTEQAASSLQQTASSMEQLTGTVKQSADSARQANQLAASAAEVAAARRHGRLPGGLHHGRDQRQLARRSPTSSASSTASPSRPTSWR